MAQAAKAFTALALTTAILTTAIHHSQLNNNKNNDNINSQLVASSIVIPTTSPVLENIVMPTTQPKTEDIIIDVTPQEQVVVTDLAPHIEEVTPSLEQSVNIAVGQLVTIDESNIYYKTSEDALNNVNPVRVGSIIYPGEYEVNYIAALMANENGKYSIVNTFSNNISIAELSKSNPNLKFAIHIKLPDTVGKVNDIGWIEASQIKIAKDRGGIEYEYARQY